MGILSKLLSSFGAGGSALGTNLLNDSGKMGLGEACTMGRKLDDILGEEYPFGKGKYSYYEAQMKRMQMQIQQEQLKYRAQEAECMGLSYDKERLMDMEKYYHPEYLATMDKRIEEQDKTIKSLMTELSYLEAKINEITTEATIVHSDGSKVTKLCTR